MRDEALEEWQKQCDHATLTHSYEHTSIWAWEVCVPGEPLLIWAAHFAMQHGREKANKNPGSKNILIININKHYKNNFATITFDIVAARILIYTYSKGVF